MHNKRRQNNMNGGSGGGQHRHHNNNRPRRFNNNNRQQEGGGNDPASISRTRRAATQSREKYQMMARDAQSAGDRVQMEYYLQHADHYHRVLLALPPEEAPRPQYLRGHGPGESQHGEHTQEGSPTGTNDSNGSAEAHPHNEGHEEHHQQPHGLPSFITQPVSPEEPRE